MEHFENQKLLDGSARKRRPGPFGPASDLLPRDQHLQLLHEKTPATDAIERMVDEGYSQIPVTNSNDEIIGVFTWRSFSKRVLDLKSVAKISTVELPIKEAMEPARFISPEVYIDTETDWEDIDYVLVGSPKKPIGILCIADVFAQLNDFAEAFVLIYEIEHEVRDLIRDVYTEDELAECFEAMNLSAKRPALEVASKLEDHINENGSNPVIGKAIGLLKRTGGRPLSSLEDFTFSQYKELICRKRTGPVSRRCSIE